MKKAKIAMLCLMLLWGILLGRNAMALDNPDVVVSLQIDNPIMEVNGADAEIDPGRGTKPVIRDDRTLVPIRAIIEAFGGEVGWEESSRAVILTMEEDSIRLGIDQRIAYLNGEAETLDVAPSIINERTMLPIRFVAEGFNLGVGWDGNTQRVFVVRNGLDDSEYDRIMGEVEPYQGQAYTRMNNNQPYFKDYEKITGSFEFYSSLDDLGRCNVCFASVAADLMPTEERESIQSVKPTGWINVPYDHVDGRYLYNRCHLIGFQLTGENANERNLITGTRYLNVEGMLPFENEIAEYIKTTGNRVIYRVTPVFREDNLVADGVLLEGYSVEDKGQGISFCVYCYNVQPQVVIDYATGESALDGILETPEAAGETVYRTPSGKRYHQKKSCGGINSYAVSLSEAEGAGLTPCEKCME